MKTAVEYETKLDSAVGRITDEFSEAVVGIYVIGSITQEATPTSDCDVAVIFRDEDYRERFDEIRQGLQNITKELNTTQPDPELVLWPTKKDHYLTLFPDVSYIRRNLPDHVDRLDAWCGLAKFTLLAYEGSASRRVHGDFELPVLPEKIPVHECLELLLLSTRTLAEGLAELQSTDPSVRQRGVNHVAKAGLRAAYAAMVRSDRVARNTYRDILTAALEQFPAEHHEILRVLYDAKTGAVTTEPELDLVFALVRFCEAQIADTRRQAMGGLTMGRAGESFAFPADAFDEDPVDAGDYCRFPGFTANYVHSVYFLMSARAIAERLNSSGFDDESGLDLFFEELTTLAAFNVFNPVGMRMVVGRSERSNVDLPLGRDLLQKLAPLLAKLARAYLDDADAWATPWLSRHDKLRRLQLLLFHIAAIDGTDVPSDVTDALDAHLGDELDIDCIIGWQFPLFDGLLSHDVIEAFTKLGLLFYQSGQLDRAQRVLERLVKVSSGKSDVLSERGTAAAEAFDQELSKAHQYLAITLNRQGEQEQAREQYEAALRSDPDNYSAIDDFTRFLLDNDSPEDTATRLHAQLEQCRNARDQCVEQVAGRFHDHAVALKNAGDLETAAFFYTQAIALNPTSEKVHGNFALLKQKMGDLAGAVQLFMKTIELNPDYVNAYLNLGVLLETARQFDQAIQVLSVAVKRGIADQQVHTNLGNCHLAAGNLDAARSCYDAALAIDPNFANALGGKGSVLINGPNADDPAVVAEAANCFGRAYAADPTFVQAGAMHERLQNRLAMLKPGNRPSS